MSADPSSISTDGFARPLPDDPRVPQLVRPALVVAPDADGGAVVIEISRSVRPTVEALASYTVGSLVLARVKSVNDLSALLEL